MLVGAVLPGGASGQHIGVEAGALWSDVDWSLAVPPGVTVVDDRMAPLVGLTLRVPVARWASVGTGVSVMAKGSEYDGVVFRATFLEVPAVVSVHTGSSSGVFLEAGAAAGLRVSCSRVFRISSGEHTNDCGTEVVRDASPLPDVRLYQLRRWELSWRVGLGWRLQAGPGAAVALLRYERALTNLHPEPSQRMLSRSLALAVGYEWGRR